MARPYLRTMKPMPPPVVSPPMPTEWVSPVESARPWACAGPARSPEVAPGWTRAIRASGSMLTRFMSERSTTMAPSITLRWARLWPPLRTASGRAWSRAKLTAAATSCAFAARTIASGRRSTVK